MTTNTSINISKDKVFGKCDLKCAYNFKYPETNITAINRDVMIVFTFDKSTESAVLYNQQKYSVEAMTLVSPSIHIFNGSPAKAELVIYHRPVLGGNQLAVCIPISQSSDSSTSSNLVTELIKSVANNAPAQSETTAINISNFTLNSIVPNRPFYSYTGKSDNTDYIVYDIIDAIGLSSDTISSLSKIIKPYPLPMPGGNLFYNKLGPNQSKVGEGLYISCQPTGSSEEQVDVEYSKNSTEAVSFSNILNNPTFRIIMQILISCIIFIILFGVLAYLYSILTGDQISNPFSQIRNPFRKTE
jgi:hypothetical protein